MSVAPARLVAEERDVTDDERPATLLRRCRHGWTPDSASRRRPTSCASVSARSGGCSHALERTASLGLLHGNRGREPANRSDDRLWQRVMKLAAGKYQGVNDRHLQELLAREHGIAPKRRRRPRKYCSRREWRAASGMLLQIDASPHDWLEGRGSRLTLVGAIDDATNRTWRLAPDKVYEAYMRADRLLKDTQEAEDIARLRACARVVMRRLTTVQFDDRNFTLPGAVYGFEAKLIERALEEAGGSLTKAARLLGLTHQTLGSILDKRHKKLSPKRQPARKRLKSIIKEPKE